MKLPKPDNPAEYVGLYVIDFAGSGQSEDQCAIGYTAEEVALLLESERFAQLKVYKIHRVQPDGTMELHGVAPERFELESGMFFHSRDERSGRNDYQSILSWSRDETPPCRAKLQLARGADRRLLIALIYPAEYEHEIGNWLARSGFRTSGPVDAGISQVHRYYRADFGIVQSEQLWPTSSLQSRDRETLLAAVGQSLQR